MTAEPSADSKSFMKNSSLTKVRTDGVIDEVHIQIKATKFESGATV